VTTAHPRALNASAEKARREKATKRQKDLLDSGELATGFVRRRVVGATTRLLYTKLADPLMAKLLALRIVRTDVVAIDVKLGEALNDILFEGRSIQQARYLLYVVCWMLVQKASYFPLARATLKGFGREEPDQARDGVTFEETFMAAAAILIQFDTYQRPKAVLDLLVKDAHPPSDARAARALQVWTLVFHPSTDNPIQQDQDSRRHYCVRRLGSGLGGDRPDLQLLSDFEWSGRPPEPHVSSLKHPVQRKRKVSCRALRPGKNHSSHAPPRRCKF
jgi:hypothetical protein